MLLTRADYVQDSKKLHDKYYSQFFTDQTKSEIISRIGLDRLIKLDENLNGYFKFDAGGHNWIWDTFSFNRALLGECDNGGISKSDRTCVAKVAAREILRENGYEWEAFSKSWIKTQ